MQTASIMVRILGNTSSIDKALNGVQSKLDAMSSKMAGIKNVSLAAAGIISGVTAAMTAFSVSCVKSAADMEQTETAFKNMMGSAEAAKEFIEELQDFAAKTPFEFNQVKGAAQKFLAFGFTAKQVIPTLTAVGNAASALGMRQDGIDRLTLALGQMAAKGKVSGEEMRQLAEAGIPAWQMLAEKIGVSIPEAMDMASKGAIDAKTGLEAIVNGMNDKFSGMMDEQSQTLSGLMSTIRDNVDQTMTAIGQSLAESLGLKEWLKDMGDALDAFRKKVQTSGISEALKQMVPPELGVTLAAITGALVVLTVVGVIPLTAALWDMAAAAWAAMAPFAPFIALGAAIGAALYLLWKYSDQLKDGFINLANSIAGFVVIKILISYFEKLWGVIKSTAQFIRNVFVGALVLLEGKFDAVREKISNVINGIMKRFNELKNKWLKYFDELVDDFFRLLDDVFKAIDEFFNDVKNTLQNLIDAFLHLADDVLPDWAKTALSWVRDFVVNAISYFNDLIDKLAAVGAAMDDASAKVSDGIENSISTDDAIAIFDHQEKQRNKAKSISYDQFGGGGTTVTDHGGGGDSSSTEDNEADRLLESAKQISQAIAEEWARTFSTKVELVDRWYEEELAELDKSASANENYERDKQRLIELYEQKRIEAAQEEATRMKDIQNQIRDVWTSFNESTTLKGLTGSAQAFAELQNAQMKAADAIRDRWQKLSDDYIGMTEREQKAFRKALDDRGMAYSIDANNRISFDKLMHDELIANEAEYLRQREDMIRQNKDLEADIKAAYDALDMERLQTLLTDENILRMEQLEEQKTKMQEYQDAVMDAHFSMEKLLDNIRKNGFNELEKSISGLLQGTMTWSQALLAVGKTLNKVVSDYFAQWISGMIRQMAFGNAKQAKDVAMATATGAQVAAAWYPAAMNVLIATGGTAGATATASYMSAMSAGSAANAFTSASHQMLGITGIKMMASGGLATGPTLAMIAEGKYPEAVLPLNDDTFEGIGEGIAKNGGGNITLNVQTMDAGSFEDWLSSTAGNALKQFLYQDNRDFATDAGVW